MALSAFVCGGPTGGSTSSLVIPIGTNVPRSDPIDGMTILLVYSQLSYLSSSTITDASDDAAPQDDYSFCLFGDGLNHYNLSTGPGLAFVANDLIGGVHNVTINLDSTPDWIEAVVIAVTGIDNDNSGPPPLFDPTLPGYLDGLAQQASAPVGAPTSTSGGLGWTQDFAGAIHFGNPSTATDGDWSWGSGDLGFYFVQQVGFTSDPGSWAWADAAMTDLVQWNLDPGIGRWQSYAIATAGVVPTLAGPSVAGAWASGDLIAVGGGIALKSGLGPSCTTPPPPLGNPVFNHMFRAGAEGD